MRIAEPPVPPPAGWQAAFQLLFDTTETAVAILDERRCLVGLNTPAQQLLGLSATASTGALVLHAIVAAERERSESEWLALLRDGRASGTRTLVRADSSQVRVSFVAVVEPVEEGRRVVYALTPAGGGADEGLAAVSSLTNREGQIVRLIAEGLDTAEIAESLHVSPNTVRSHVRNAMSKLSARTRAQLVAHALGGRGGDDRRSD
jgi:DNA-binding CsgD family transcriptional regulator